MYDNFATEVISLNVLTIQEIILSNVVLRQRNIRGVQGTLADRETH